MNIDEIITGEKFSTLSENKIYHIGADISLSPDKDIFFVKTDFINYFRENILPRINYKFKLITHDSDYPITSDHLDILNNSLLDKWFGMNCHVVHPNLQPIPIGMANEKWPHGNKDVISKIIKEKNQKNKLVYCNFDISTNYNARSDALHELTNHNFIDFETNKLPFEEYIRKLSTYKYVISPPGNSVDCHRIWESIYVDTIPICLKSLPLAYFKDCPIMFLNNWSEVTVDKLEAEYKYTQKKSKNKAYMSYYVDMILQSK